jgi:hypothetical protein
MLRNPWSVLAIVIGIVLLGSGQLAAAQDPVSGLLLRFQMTIDYDEVSTSEVLFYRDGLVVTRSTAGGTAYYGRGSLSAANLDTLRSLLNVNHVGLISAPPGCKLPSPLPTGAIFDGALTWFGRNGRSNYLAFGKPGDDGCPTDLINLFFGVYDLDVDYTDVITTVP